MLKYLPQVDRKNAQSKSSGGQLTRQVTNLKTTLKHTTDNAVMLEKSIGDKSKEADDLMKRLEAVEMEARQKEQEIFMFQMDNVLSKKIQKQINLSNILSLQHESKVFEELANNKFKARANIEALKSQVVAEKTQAEKLEAILKEFVSSKPEYEKVISMLLKWD